MSKQVIIGGVDYTNNVSTGLSYIQKLDYDLDEGTLTIPFSTRQQSFDMFTLVKFKENNQEVISFTIADDDVSIVSYSPLLYKHEIQLIELTKYLEYFIVNGKTFTQPLDTNEPLYSMYDIMIDLLETTPLSEFGNPRPKAVVSNDVKQLLKDTIANEHTFKEQTLRECLDEIVSDLDAIVRLKSDGTITLDFFNETKQFITDGLNKWNGLSTNQNIGQYALSLESSALNSITDDKQGYKVSSYPSFYGYASPRSTDTLFNFDNAYFPTPYPIYDVRFLNVYAEYTVKFTPVTENKQTGDKSTGTVINVDQVGDVQIQDRVLERNAYKTLDSALLSQTGGQDLTNINKYYQENTLVYDYSKPNVDISNTFGLFDATNTIEFVIRASIIRMIRNSNVGGYTVGDIEYDGDSFVSNETDLTITRTRVELVLDNKSGYDDGNIPYNIVYTPIPKEVRFSIDRNFTDDVKIDTTMLVNQSNRIVDLSGFKGNALGRVNKMGNRQKQLSHRVNKLSDSYNIGDYTSDNYIITEKEVIILRDFYQIHYTLSKNFNKISQFTGINSEERQWEISSDGRTLERHLLYKNYCIIKPTEDIQTNEFTSNLGFLGKQKVIDSLTNNWEDIKYPNFLEVETITKGDDYGKFVLPLNREGGGNTFTYSFTFDNNASVGTKVIGEAKNENLITNLIDRNVNSFTKYTDDLGRLDRIKLKAFNTENTYTDYNDVVEEAKLIPEMGDSYNVDLNEVLFECDLDVRKDSRENLKGTFELQILPNDIDVILGENFVGLSPFLMSKSRTLKFNAFNEPLQQNLRKYIPTPDFQADLQYTIDYTNGYIRVDNNQVISSNWAITTEDNELLIGFNNASNKKYINFNFYKERPDIDYTPFLDVDTFSGETIDIVATITPVIESAITDAFGGNTNDQFGFISAFYSSSDVENFGGFTLDESGALSIVETSNITENLGGSTNNKIGALSLSETSVTGEDFGGSTVDELATLTLSKTSNTTNDFGGDTLNQVLIFSVSDTGNPQENYDGSTNDAIATLSGFESGGSLSFGGSTLDKFGIFAIADSSYTFELESLGTTTQSYVDNYDVTFGDLVNGPATNCPTQTTVDNTAPETINPFLYNENDVIRLRAYKVSYDETFDQYFSELCEEYYYRVVRT